MIVSTPGITLDLPAGWEAEIDAGAGAAEAGGEIPVTPRVHIANFPLPTPRGDFGSGAVETMIGGDVLICLLEESSNAVGTPVYAHQGIPTLAAGDFSPDRMQRPLKGRSGTQVFFSAGQRAFVVYVVLGSHASRASLVPAVNGVLGRITIEAS